MIPRASIVTWSATAPWPSEDQVEQDLIVSRLLVEIAADPLLSEELAFRGGTCLHKLHLNEPQRYSEDLDFVRTDQRPILGEVFDRLRAVTERIGLREHRRTFPSKDSDTATMWFDADAESGATTIRVKIETNVAESTPHSNHVFIPFEVTSPWWSGSADVRTFTIEEILATKVRALCQRRKGRDSSISGSASTSPKSTPVRSLRRLVTTCRTASTATPSSSAISRPSSPTPTLPPT